ncbi:unnamed protein product [Spirodela intermedia]|uniref:Uncharacterized protein n=1 Tax=Spirodela intermedia TaxID=51605 RepID=A0A7I8J9E1_SPIIN|nr:unnamed protein product [Spirodela intermedia]CAA6666836.1 unnamed protein product [Spirodela intermedia]
MADLKQIHAQIIRAGLDQHVFVVGRIISFCSVSEVGSIAYAAEVFERMERPDGFLWNTIIRGLEERGTSGRLSLLPAHAGGWEGRRQLHLLIPAQDVRADGVHRAGQAGPWLRGEGGLGLPPTCQEHPHPHVRHVQGSECRPLPTRGNARQESAEGNLGVLLEMQRCGFPPTSSALWTRKVGALAHRRLWARAAHRDLQLSDRHVRQVWRDQLRTRAVRGNGGEERRLLELHDPGARRARLRGGGAGPLRRHAAPGACAEPNAVTFLGVLCACSRAGLVEQGRRLFDSMTNHHRIAPTIQHYGCMADLLARAGLMREAYKLVVAMPIEPKAVVWRTLLAACRVHGDLKPGERIRWHLLDWDPDHSGDYVLLSHMYAGAGGGRRRRRSGSPWKGGSREAGAWDGLVCFRAAGQPSLVFMVARRGPVFQEDFNGPEENGPPLDEPAAMAYPIAARNIYRRPIR